MITQYTSETVFREATGKNAGELLPPVPYGATRFEVQRDASFKTGAAAHRVATFDTLKEALAYVALERERDRLSAALDQLVAACKKVALPNLILCSQAHAILSTAIAKAKGE